MFQPERTQPRWPSKESVLTEILDALRSGDGVNLVREAVRFVLQELIEAEAIEVIGARRLARTAHDWLHAYAAHGLAGLIDKSSRPNTCPHQMPPEIEARRR